MGGFRVLIAEFYENVMHIKDRELLDRLLQASELRRVKKGEVLLRVNEVQQWCPLLVSGLIRGYLLDVNGRDISECFCYEPGTAVISCLGLEEISPISFEALEESELVCVRLPELQQLLGEYVELLWLYNRMLLAAMRTQWETKMALYQYTGRQRYEWFLRTYPSLANRVSDKHIATYLGITPVTLSRLRRALREEGVI